MIDIQKITLDSNGTATIRAEVSSQDLARKRPCPGSEDIAKTIADEKFEVTSTVDLTQNITAKPFSVGKPGSPGETHGVQLGCGLLEPSGESNHDKNPITNEGVAIKSIAGLYHAEGEASAGEFSQRSSQCPPKKIENEKQGKNTAVQKKGAPIK
jgi:hypothetical protein